MNNLALYFLAFSSLAAKEDKRSIAGPLNHQWVIRIEPHSSKELSPTHNLSLTSFNEIPEHFFKKYSFDVNENKDGTGLTIEWPKAEAMLRPEGCPPVANKTFLVSICWQFFKKTRGFGPRGFGPRYHPKKHEKKLNAKWPEV